MNNYIVTFESRVMVTAFAILVMIGLKLYLVLFVRTFGVTSIVGISTINKRLPEDLSTNPVEFRAIQTVLKATFDRTRQNMIKK